MRFKKMMIEYVSPFELFISKDQMKEKLIPLRDNLQKWCHGVVVITTAQIHSSKPELRFCKGSKPACSVSEIWDGEDL